MSGVMMASIIVDNYNYGRFLKEAIESALNQTYPHKEVVVVDDGSADNSREIIAGFGDRIIPVVKENGGQASAFNAGFRKSRGEVILFLDSDDALLPSAVENAVACFREGGVAKTHWPLWQFDEQGIRTGESMPLEDLQEGDLRPLVLRNGPDGYTSPPTTGNAWSRTYLEQVMPIPQADYRICADSYLLALAPLFGTIKRIAEPQGLYRLHGANNYARKSTAAQIKLGMRFHLRNSAALRERCGRMGITVNGRNWRRNNPYYRWMKKLGTAIKETVEWIPRGETFLLADQDEWAMESDVSGRRRIPFPEHDGQYWGPPADDESAIGEVERWRESGANFLIVGWPAFWWLDYYAGLHQHLRTNYTCAHQNERLMVFDLRGPW